MNDPKNDLEINLMHIFRVLWQHIGFIIAAAIIGAVVAFPISLLVPKTYQSSCTFYVSNISSSNTSYITTSEINGAKSLVDTYVVLLKMKTTLSEIMDESGLSNYTTSKVKKAITASALGDTEVFFVTVTTNDPQESKALADAVSVVLPERIAEIIPYSQISLVEKAALPSGKSGPNTMKYIFIGFLFGALVSVAAIIIIELLDDTISSEEYLTQQYDVPVLAVVPDLLAESKSEYYKARG